MSIQIVRHTNKVDLLSEHPFFSNSFGHPHTGHTPIPISLYRKIWVYDSLTFWLGVLLSMRQSDNDKNTSYNLVGPSMGPTRPQARNIETNTQTYINDEYK